MRSRSRIHELDGLRALAIIAVMLWHFFPNFHMALGWAGVDLFFVLSGFLITGILLDLRADPTPYRKFYWRRLIRIFPPYYAALAIIATLAFSQHDIGSRSQWLGVLFFLPAIRTGCSFRLIFHRLVGHAGFDFSHVQFSLAPTFSRFIDGLGIYWSVAVEELFYLFWAPLILKCSRRAILVFAIAPIFLCPVLRGLNHTHDYFEYFGFIPRLDTLALGGCLALLLRAKPNISRWVLLAPILPVVLGLGWLCVHCGLLRGVEVRSTELFSVVGYTLLALLFGCVVATCVRCEGHPLLTPLRLKPLIYIGTISYTMYLTHAEIYVIASRVCRGELIRGLASMLATVAVAGVSWKYFESPILRLRNWPERVRRSSGESQVAQAG